MVTKVLKKLYNDINFYPNDKYIENKTGKIQMQTFEINIHYSFVKQILL
jgi:hypothetical protein